MPPCTSSLFIDVLPESCNREDEQDGDEERNDPPEYHHAAAPSKISVVHHSEFTVVLSSENSNRTVICISDSGMHKPMDQGIDDAHLPLAVAMFQMEVSDP